MDTVLDVEAGMGFYSSTSNSLGIKSWGGTIKLDNDGQISEHPFKASL